MGANSVGANSPWGETGSYRKIHGYETTGIQTVTTVEIKCRVLFKEGNSKAIFQSSKRRTALKISTNTFMSFHIFSWRMVDLVLKNEDIIKYVLELL